MAIFTPKKVIDGANNSEVITSSPYAKCYHTTYQNTNNINANLITET